jgi:hypothetical protein
MTPQQISQDVARGLELREQIKTSQAELKTIEKRLETAGLEGEQIPLTEADREGRQFIARSPAAGIAVPVIFESDQIVASFVPDSPVHQAITPIAGTHLPLFFREIVKFERIQKDGHEFRKLARETYGPHAPEFIAASLQRDKNGIPRSRTIIAWENAKPIPQP